MSTSEFPLPSVTTNCCRVSFWLFLFYADAGLKSALASASNAGEDELVPDQGTPKIADLATDKTIHVELLPPYLSSSVGQRYKEYLVIENLVVCLLVAAISALCAVIIDTKDMS
jgi:hypothetical protein